MSKGYWDIDIQDSNYLLNEDTKKTHITITIQEGLIYRFNSIKFIGNDPISIDQLMSFVEFENNKPLDQIKLIALQQTIREHYNNLGYLMANVSFQYQKTRIDDYYLIDIVINIDSKRLFYFGDIFIFGLTKTQKKIVEDEITFVSDEAYSLDKIQSTYRNLLNLGIFSSVRIDSNRDQSLREGSNLSHRRDISIVLEEGKKWSCVLWTRI